jgi:Uncharacterised protein family (UPF0236)
MDLQPQVASIVAKLRETVETLAQALEPGGPGLDPGELERRCRAVGLTFAHDLLALLWPRYGTGDQGPAVRCPCGGTRRRVGRRPRDLRDLLNHTLTVDRTYYFCRTCGQGWLPLDETLGLPRVAATPALFEAVVTCGSVAPPEEAADLLTRLAGVTLSPKSVERYTKAAGQAVEQAVAARAQAMQAECTPGPAGAPEPSTRPYNVQFDGSMLRMRRGGFREVKVGCLFDVRDLAAVRAGRRELLRKHHEVQLGGPEPLGDRMYAAARAAGVTADGSNAISQGDGAPWVWNLVQLHWPAAREVLDFYHLSEHLHACAQAVWGVGSARARAWARAVGEQALQGDAGVLRQALGHLRPTTVTGQQAVAALRRYVQTHAARLDYGALRAEGYAVASAAVESAHHSLVQRRCKRPGQRWSEPGLRAILAARRLWCNRDSPADVTSLGAVRYLVGPRYHHRAA